MNYHRVGFAFTAPGRDRLIALSKKHNVAQTAMVEAILFALEDAAVGALIEKGMAIRDRAVGDIKTLRKQARNRVKDMPADELAKFLAEGDSKEK